MHQMRRIVIEEGRDSAASLMAGINAFAEILRSRMDVERIILFGSVARGDFNEGSDVDLLFVGDFTERFPQRPVDIIILTDLPIKPVCYTGEEFAEMLWKKNPIVPTVCEEMSVI